MLVIAFYDENKTFKAVFKDSLGNISGVYIA